MQRDPARQAYGYPAPASRPTGEQPMSMLEAALFFGVLVLILDAIGAVVGRAVGWNAPLCACVNVFFYAAAGFVAARYTATVNGIWAGIMVAALDTVFGQAIILAILPEYRAMLMSSAETQQAIPGGVLAVVAVIYVLVATISTFILGSFWGLIGAAIARSGPFRPKEDYLEAY